ncbi:metal ABC transporter substrate-binding protein [Blastococcus sp. CCUG 61487]|uniref:metal ABC transporter substrate-binding protein n=1 Tax=Blastococcus sp. CCUG 61487 TaxID=1840703 RepID=UPI0010BF7D8A|nr:metal ABC transporter substrate-binding protein [Blastococcus sp. CCUG 61487]TKJ31745.1 ABC transporter substrate-binding protein [Blastococcus sp. CCUG 61487]
MFTTGTRMAGAALTSMALLLTAGCGGEDGAGSDGELQVVAGFYPLEWAAERIGGDRLSVSALTPPGGEPHDLELTPRDVASIEEADLVVLLSGFQPALDEAADSSGGDRVWDAADAADLLTGDHEDHEHGDDDEDHGDEDHGHDDGDSPVDPHFWLDPLRLADVGDALAERLAETDPDGADAYAENAAALRADLERLHAEMSAGLADCAVDTLVTAHDAFGYLAERYGLEVVGISGLSPSQEPAASELAQITRLVAERGVTTVYTETLVEPAVAETVAEEAGVDTAVLDPLEGLSDESAGEDYLEVMRANLATLQAGQSC